jgi:hypothetical protein
MMQPKALWRFKNILFIQAIIFARLDVSNLRWIWAIIGMKNEINMNTKCNRKWSRPGLSKLQPRAGSRLPYTFIQPANVINTGFKKLGKKLFHSIKLYIFWKLCNFPNVSRHVGRLVRLTPPPTTLFLTGRSSDWGQLFLSDPTE